MNALVVKPICPLFLTPSPKSQRSDEALLGMAVTVLEAAGGWRRVLTHYGYTGWAGADSLLPEDGGAALWADAPKAVVTRGLCDLLALPDIKSPVLLGLVRGCLLAVVGGVDPGGWQCVRLPDGRTGYVRGGFLGPFYPTPAASDETTLRGLVARAALSYLGAPYRWGGKTPLGVDCSGLTGMAYLLNGVVIWRDAQMRAGFPVRPIPLADARPADLLYFPGHIALYLGGGRYVHATAKDGSDGVVINSLTPRSPSYRADLAESLTAVGSIF